MPKDKNYYARQFKRTEENKARRKARWLKLREKKIRK